MTYKELLLSVHNGRIAEIINSFDFDVCYKCSFWDKKLGPDKAYRCHCIGSCPDASLSDNLKRYIQDKLPPYIEVEDAPKNNVDFIETVIYNMVDDVTKQIDESVLDVLRNKVEE